jgi:hypothetical protein
MIPGYLINKAIFGQDLDNVLMKLHDVSQVISTTTPIVVLCNIGNFCSGVCTQYLNDVTYGLFGKLTGVTWENGGGAFQSGCQAGRYISLIQGSIESVLGVYAAATFLTSIPATGGGTFAAAIPSGGTSLFIGPIVIPFELAGVVVSTGVALHGAGVLFYDNRNPFRENGNDKPRSGDPVPGKTGIEITRSKTTGKNAIDYESQVTGKPYPDLEIEIHNVPNTKTGRVGFDWYIGDTLLDAKYVGKGSVYDLSRPEPFIHNSVERQLLDEAYRQTQALLATDQFTTIEWWVSNQNSASLIQNLLLDNGYTAITVRWVP